MDRHRPRIDPEIALRRKLRQQIREKLGSPAWPPDAEDRLKCPGTGAAPHSRHAHLLISARALAKLIWTGKRTAGAGYSLWGELALTSEGSYRLEDTFFARPSGPAACCPPLLSDHRELLARLKQERGLEYWRLACWIHFHPPGLELPTPQDHAAFYSLFGAEPLSFMLLVTRPLRFYGLCSAMNTRSAPFALRSWRRRLSPPRQLVL